MAFTVQDYNDLVRLLAAHPEWRPELRRLVLSDELLDLPRAVQALTEAQRHTDAQLAQLTDRVDQLAEAQRHTDAQLAQLTEAQRHTDARLDQLTFRVDQLTDRMVQLVEAQQQSEARLAGVEERLARLEASLQELTHQVRVLVLQVQNLAEAQQQTTDRLGRVVGDLLELRYREHAAGYFGRHLRRARAVALVDIEEALEAALSPEELLEALRLDLLVRGRRRDRPDVPEVWLAVEWLRC